MENVGIQVNSIRGYLAFCQNQLPEMDISYILSGGQEWSRVDANDKFRSMADIWKQLSDTERSEWDVDASKNLPHPGESKTHPRLTPFEIQELLNALWDNTASWNESISEDEA